MEETLTNFLALVGLVSLGGAIILLIAIFIDFVGEKIEKAKRKHKIKHRFDKTPKAKCYCVDCWYYEANGSMMGKCFF